MKIVLSYSCFLFFTGLSNCVNAQEKKIDRSTVLSNYVFKGNHINLNFAALSYPKARMVNATGTHPVRSANAPGVLAGISYTINFNQRQSMIFGPEATIAGRNFITSISKNEFSPPLTEDFNLSKWRSLMLVAVFRFPLQYQHRWMYGKTKYLFAEAGASLNYSIGADFYSSSITLQNTSNDFFNAGGVDLNENNEQLPWVSFPINVGHAWLLKNNCVVQLMVCSTVSFTKFVDGSYTIDIPGKPITTGSYSSTGSYIGLSARYVFTNANYRIRKAYEKMK